MPDIYQTLLPRDGVARRIDSAVAAGAVCLTAPFGYGKTMAVADWLGRGGRKSHWVTLDAGDNTSALDALESGAASGTDPERVLVLDNLQVLQELPQLRRVRALVESCLGRRPVVLISRAELPPVFNDLILRGRLRRLTPVDLSFTPQETADYFAREGFEADPGRMVELHSLTEGWPAALNAVMAASQGGAPRYDQTARNYILTYFETEVWHALSGSVRDFLIKTAILDELTPFACHAVTGLGETLPQLKWLLANGLFITQLEGVQRFRYHRVFREFLLEKLDASAVDRRGLNTRVGWWLFERGEAARAFPYFFKAGDYYGIDQALRALNPAEIGLERYLEVAGCITGLDSADLRPYAILVMRIALIHFLLGNMAEMQRLSALFFRWLTSGELPISAEEYGEYVWEAGWLNYIDPAVPTHENADHREWSNYHEYVPHIKPTHIQRHAVLGLPSAMSGLRDYCESAASAEAFLRRNEETGRSLLRQEYALLQTELIAAEYAYEIEDFTKAEQVVRRVMAAAEAARHIDLYFVCTVLLVKLRRATNKTGEIDALAGRLETLICQHDQHFLLPNFHAFALRNRLANRQPGFTDIFLAENEAYKDKPYFFLRYRQITYVRALLSLGLCSEAQVLLGNLELSCRTYKRTYDLIEVCILKAIASHSLGLHELAGQALEQALDTAAPYGFVRLFSDEAAALWPMLEARRRQSTTKYIQNVIISCKKTMSSTGYQAREKKFVHLELTRTERKILGLLAADMSYLEIAQDCGIRISTVKSHVHSLYSKLEVGNRTSAVLEARRLGILE